MGHWTPTSIEPMDYDDDDAIFKITDFSYCFRIFTILCLGNKFSPYFELHNVGRFDTATRVPYKQLHWVFLGEQISFKLGFK